MKVGQILIDTYLGVEWVVTQQLPNGEFRLNVNVPNGPSIDTGPGCHFQFVEKEG